MDQILYKSPDGPTSDRPKNRGECVIFELCLYCQSGHVCCILLRFFVDVYTCRVHACAHAHVPFYGHIGITFRYKILKIKTIFERKLMALIFWVKMRSLHLFFFFFLPSASSIPNLRLGMRAGLQVMLHP